MIVTTLPEGEVLVRQVDHQEQCALMAGGWGNAAFRRPSAHDALVAAAGCHDEGWREWEAAPQVGPDGRPVDFPDIDRGEHVELYSAGIEAACRLGDRVGLLVSMHGAGLYRNRLGLDSPVQARAHRPQEVARFLEQEDVRQARLRARLGDGAPLERWAWAAYRLLQAWDLLSLALVWGRLAGRDVVLRRVPRDEEDTEGVDLTVRPAGRWRATIDPWPFAGDRLDLPVRARIIPPAPYAGAADLAAALAAAPWTELPVVILPAGSAADGALGA